MGTIISLALQALHATISFNPKAYNAILRTPESLSVILVIVFIEGVSLLLGQSVTLFINRIAPRRFIASLLLNGFFYIFSFLCWDGFVFTICKFILRIDTKPWTITEIMFLGSIPLIFSFLILLPYFGLYISQLIYLWSFLIALGATAYILHINLIEASICIGTGWVLTHFIRIGLGKPLERLREKIWVTLLGYSLKEAALEMPKNFYIDITNEIA